MQLIKLKKDLLVPIQKMKQTIVNFRVKKIWKKKKNAEKRNLKSSQKWEKTL